MSAPAAARPRTVKLTAAPQPIAGQCPVCRTFCVMPARLHLGIPHVACPACGEQRWRAIWRGGHTTMRED